ncbi:MAG: type III-A CRISPR-associated RAMP protein Csm4 [Candidatus Brocadia sp.]|nr:type III-A CRISPR-associated RAMP protein Csm4 [Candidatus Brocadia sp.]
MKIYQIKLTPSSSFSSLPSSDTLFGAICWGIRRIYQDSSDKNSLVDILHEFQLNPKFVISSTFPYIEEANTAIPFYPRPILECISASNINKMAQTKKEIVCIISRYKEFKKAEYVSASLFMKILNGTSEGELFKIFYNGGIKLTGKLLMDDEEYKTIFEKLNPGSKSMAVQKNSTDRLTMSTGGEGQTFYQQEYFTSPAFKLHFLMKTNEIDFFRPVFRYLKDKGIGGNRSVGKGRFKIDILNEVSIGDDNSRKFFTLSRYIPDVKQINLESPAMFYEIFPYRSKVDSEAEFKGKDVWKSKVMYLKEGSCFEANEKREFYGRIPVVKEINRQKIYQNGLAFPVFGNIGGSR